MAIVRGGIQQPQGIDPQALVQLAMATHETKRQDAQQNLDLALKLISQGVNVDPKVIEKNLKVFGIDTKDITPPGAPSGASGSPSGGQSPMTEAAPGIQSPNASTMPFGLPNIPNLGVNPSGAQAANPASKQAGKKAPGGGVMSDVTNPANVQGMGQAAQNKFNALAPIYQNAMTRAQIDSVRAANELHIAQLQERAMSGDMRAAGQLMLASDPSGKSLSTDKVLALYGLAGTDEEKKQVFDFMLGNETPAAKSARNDTNFRAIFAANPDIGPEAARVAANAITNGNPVPNDVEAKIASITQQSKETEAYFKALEYLPADKARLVAQAVGAGVPLAEALPTGLKSIAEKQLQVSEEMKGLEAKRLDVEMKHYEEETARLNAAAATKKDPRIEEDLDQLAKYAVMKKAGVDLPKEMLQNTINDLAERTGMEVQAIHHWWGTTTYEFSPSADMSAAGAGAGAPQTGGGPGQRPSAGGISARDVGKAVGSVEGFWFRPETYKDLHRHLSDIGSAVSRTTREVVRGAEEGVSGDESDAER